MLQHGGVSKVTPRLGFTDADLAAAGSRRAHCSQPFLSRSDLQEHRR